MKVLVACECSGTVRDAFLAEGHDAWSCDIKPDEKGSNRLMSLSDTLKWRLKMRDYVHEHFTKHAEQVRPAIICADGTKYSVQASKSHYCAPRENGAEKYSAVEVWGPFTREPEGWVRVSLINRRIHAHGGVL